MISRVSVRPRCLACMTISNVVSEASSDIEVRHIFKARVSFSGAMKSVCHRIIPKAAEGTAPYTHLLHWSQLDHAQPIPPHPGPLPQGEGGSSPIGRRIACPGNVRGSGGASPSPRGEGRGEGEWVVQHTSAFEMKDPCKVQCPLPLSSADGRYQHFKSPALCVANWRRACS